MLADVDKSITALVLRSVVEPVIALSIPSNSVAVVAELPLMNKSLNTATVAFAF